MRWRRTVSKELERFFVLLASLESLLEVQRLVCPRCVSPCGASEAALAPLRTWSALPAVVSNWHVPSGATPAGGEHGRTDLRESNTSWWCFHAFRSSW